MLDKQQGEQGPIQNTAMILGQSPSLSLTYQTIGGWGGERENQVQHPELVGKRPTYQRKKR